ncbi:hypothetical protein ANO11243_075770 [Dothideomycetidae sp. 11243]|nr:hypothetical protein ANO11243_075770 [fungal sp. No.11243]
MSPAPPLQKIAIVGATGRIGGVFAKALLKTGKHTVTALTRSDSEAAVPSGCHVVKADYASEDSLVAALRGQQFLIITLSARAPPETELAIIDAAVKAGITWVMPNMYGGDHTHQGLVKDDLISHRKAPIRRHLEQTGRSWISVGCGFWYQWSLACGEQWYGFDIKNKHVTLFDQGTQKIGTSTWDQCGNAIAALLSLPESGAELSLDHWRDNALRFCSFRVSQRDMLDSLHRVMGTTDADWDITHEKTHELYQNGLAELKAGDMRGFAKAMYTRYFYPDGAGDYESRHELANGILGLPKESLDAATKEAVDMVESGWTYMRG